MAEITGSRSGAARGRVLLAGLLLGATPAWAGGTERVSVSSGGRQANGDSAHPALSADGHFVAFSSAASNLARGTEGWHVYVRDRATGRTELASVGPSGAPVYGADPAPSADTRIVAFSTRKDGEPFEVFVRDRQAGTTEPVSVTAGGEPADGDSYGPATSADGRFVAFYSEATNLVGGDTNGVGDVFVRDLLTGRTERVSVSSGGRQGNGYSEAPSVSTHGRYVAFSSGASNLVQGDTNGAGDVFVRDRKLGTTERVSVTARGKQPKGSSYGPAITGDGRFVVFMSESADLVPGDTNDQLDVFLRDRKLGTIERVSVTAGGKQANSGSFIEQANRVVTLDGRFVVFESYASNLVPGDTNGTRDVFVRDRGTGTTERVSVSSGGAQGNGESAEPVISGGSGGYVAFVSAASNLVPGDTNRRFDIFVRAR